MENSQLHREKLELRPRPSLSYQTIDVLGQAKARLLSRALVRSHSRSGIAPVTWSSVPGWSWSDSVFVAHPFGEFGRTVIGQELAGLTLPGGGQLQLVSAPDFETCLQSDLLEV